MTLPRDLRPGSVVCAAAEPLELFNQVIGSTPGLRLATQLADRMVIGVFQGWIADVTEVAVTDLDELLRRRPTQAALIERTTAVAPDPVPPALERVVIRRQLAGVHDGNGNPVFNTDVEEWTTEKIDGTPWPEGFIISRTPIPRPEPPPPRVRVTHLRPAIQTGGFAQVRVAGRVRPGDPLVAAGPDGMARAVDSTSYPASILGKALEAHEKDGEGLIRALLGWG